jgi:hypothetical protein
MPPQRKGTWDTENRLIAVEPTVPVEDDVKLKFEYDCLGRQMLRCPKIRCQEMLHVSHNSSLYP